ncbi:extracellular solute-binding protein [Paenibacillus sp. MDMC362]|uniref:extracellular solute-binding protein n=1 Tax=Paenibacillus sp. MDMC362 TaxID=2977365 RepID=UPI000DC462E3|nr:extracellular solute-binding protein [Paenibacillus sp. MDMC362]RAR38530.1 hypothetical protein DP091_30930 [Paenibacillus sp. MDMC362]
MFVNKKRWVSSALAAMMAVTLLAGCGNGSSDQASQPGNGSTVSEEGGENAMGKPKLMFWNLDGNAEADSYGVTALKEKFDIDVEFVSVGREAFKEKLNLMIASGEIPDWWKEPSFPEYDKFLQQEVAAEVPQDLIEEHMPKYVAWLKRYLGDDPFRYVRRDGKIYGLPVLWDIGIDGMQLGFREDWLKKVGIAKKPETLEEMEAALTAFRNNDPDGNGKKDTYGITSSAESIGSLYSSVFGAFDVYPSIFVEKEGKVVRGEIEPGAKQALEVLHRWYKNELIDPEFVVNKASNVEDKVLTDKVGAIEYYWWAFIPGNAFLGGEQWYDKLKQKKADFNWAISPGVKGPEGKYGMAQYHPSFASGVMFGKQLNDNREKLIKYLQVFETTQFDPEMYEKLNFGEKGKTWNIGEKGTVQFIPPYNDEKERKRAGIGGYSMSGSFNDYDFQTTYTSEESLRQLAKDTRAQGTRNIDILAPFNKPIYNEYQDKLSQFTLQQYVDFITGRQSLSEFDNYVAKWKSMGGDKVLEEAQKVYDENFKN